MQGSDVCPNIHSPKTIMKTRNPHEPHEGCDLNHGHFFGALTYMQRPSKGDPQGSHQVDQPPNP